MGKLTLMNLAALAVLLSVAYAIPPFYDWGLRGMGMGMGMMGPWGRMEGAFRKHMISSLEEKCEQWQRDEFEGLDLADEEQTRVRDLCRDLADSYTAPFELISILSRRNPEEVPYADLYQN